MESVDTAVSAEFSQLLLHPQDTAAGISRCQHQQGEHVHHHQQQQKLVQLQQQQQQSEQCYDCGWSDLPHACLVSIMRLVSFKDRLQSCSLVCCSWSDAAAATDSILISQAGSLSESSTCSLELWARKHGSALRKLQLGLPRSFDISSTRMLLRQLVSAAQLTSVSLFSTYILHRRNPFCCKELALLPQLQQLELDASSRLCMFEQDWNLSKALTGLQTLTQLKISGKFQGHKAAMSVQHIWALTRLQHLDLFIAEAGYSYFRRCPGEMFAGLSDMTQLSALSLAAPFRYLGAASSPQGSTGGPTELLPGLEQLTQLQFLKLQRSCVGTSWVQPALLSRLTNLRHLALKFDWLAPNRSGEQELLQLLPQLQHLTGLELQEVDLRAYSVTVFTSLAPLLVGSSLRHLSLDGTQLPLFFARNTGTQSGWQYVFSGSSSTPLQLESLSLCSVLPAPLPVDNELIRRRCCKLTALCLDGGDCGLGQ